MTVGGIAPNNGGTNVSGFMTSSTTALGALSRAVCVDVGAAFAGEHVSQIIGADIWSDD